MAHTKISIWICVRCPKSSIRIRSHAFALLDYTVFFSVCSWWCSLIQYAYDYVENNSCNYWWRWYVDDGAYNAHTTNKPKSQKCNNKNGGWDCGEVLLGSNEMSNWVSIKNKVQASVDTSKSYTLCSAYAGKHVPRTFYKMLILCQMPSVASCIRLVISFASWFRRHCMWPACNVLHFIDWLCC